MIIGGIYMERIETLYGILNGATDTSYHKNGKLRSCQLEEYNQIATPIGVFVPQYGEINTRTKFREAVSFYDTGEIKSIYLKEPTYIATTVGVIKGEFITFYKGGAIHRVFPLYGQISGYWSEEEEYKLAEKSRFKIGDIQVDNKINSYCFYPSGHLKSLSLWGKEILTLQLRKKNIAVRFGVAFYENGNIKSLEPYIPTLFKTPIGEIMAYSNAAIGIHGDTNSLVFDEEGRIKGITTVSTTIRIESYLYPEQIIAPRLVRSKLDSETWVISPVSISFSKDQVMISDENATYLFDKKAVKWQTTQTDFIEKRNECLSCEGCQSCV